MEWVTTSTVLEKLHDFAENTAWELLAEHYREPIVRFGRRRGLNAADADDAAQETLIAFAQAFRQGRYDPSKGRMKSWLFGIANRQILNARRRILKRGERSPAGMETAASLFEQLAVSDDELEQWWEQEWRRAVFERCLKRVQAEVDEEQFAIFSAMAFGDRSGEEVAEEFGVARGKVYNVKHRITKRIAELAKSYEDS